MTAKPGGRSPRRGKGAGDDDLARLIDEFAERLCRGETLDWPTCLKQHPRHAEALQLLAPAIEALAKFADAQRTLPEEFGSDGK